MNRAFESRTNGTPQAIPEDIATAIAEDDAGVEAELARYLPHIYRMSVQLKQTSEQIETSVVGVCNSFQGIAERAGLTVARTSSFLGEQGHEHSGKQSFDGLIDNCGQTLVKILNATDEASEISQRAIDRIQQMDKASQLVSGALLQFEAIARGNRILALNARIEAARAGALGAGFGVVAVEVLSQSERSQKLTVQVGDLITNLRGLAGSTLDDLRRMNDQGHKRAEQCRAEVNESLRDLQTAHGEMKEMLAEMTNEGALLARDIGSAVRGLQFQDRTSQRIAHVVEDLDTLHARLVTRFGGMLAGETASDDGFSAYTMHEEREVAGMGVAEAAGGDVELF
jgi:methyl-accepting chemotaxis protein